MQIKKALIIYLTLFIALLLNVLPLPYQIGLLNPDWLALLIIYWLIAMPQSIGVGMIWLLGIISDLLHGNLLGEHSLALLLITYLVVRLQRYLRMYPWWQQAIWVLALILLEQGILYAIQAMLGWSSHVYLLCSAVTSALAWPLISLFLGKLTVKIQQID